MWHTPVNSAYLDPLLLELSMADTAHNIRVECLSHDTTFSRMSARAFESNCFVVARTFGVKVIGRSPHH